MWRSGPLNGQAGEAGRGGAKQRTHLRECLVASAVRALGGCLAQSRPYVVVQLARFYLFRVIVGWLPTLGTKKKLPIHP